VNMHEMRSNKYIKHHSIIYNCILEHIYPN